MLSSGFKPSFQHFVWNISPQKYLFSFLKGYNVLMKTNKIRNCYKNSGKLALEFGKTNWEICIHVTHESFITISAKWDKTSRQARKNELHYFQGFSNVCAIPNFGQNNLVWFPPLLLFRSSCCTIIPPTVHLYTEHVHWVWLIKM